MKKWVIPNKIIDNENVEYEWKTETGACEVCQAMEGTIYESANDIPDRPHPNCKCWIDVQEKDNDENLTDPFEIRREIYKDKKRTKLEKEKLLGDAKSLENEVDEYIKRVDEQYNEIEKIEKTVDTAKLASNDRQKISDAKEKIHYAKNKGDKVKQEVLKLKGKITTTGTIEEILKIKFELIRLNQIKEDLIVKYTDKWFANIAGELFSIIYNTPEALALYKIGSPEMNGYKDYVQKNGQMYNSVNELKNYQLEKDFSDRLQKEIGKKDAPILVLRSDSSMANAILNSDELQTFVINNISSFVNGETINNQTITFKNGDLYNALHGAVIREAKIDSHGYLNIQILDIWNFNKNRPSVRGRIGEKYQNSGELINYGILVLIKIPKEKWKKILHN